MDQGFEASATSAPIADAGTSSSHVSTPETSSAPTTEKLVPQSEVNRIIGKTRQEAYERAMREKESRPSEPHQTQSMGGITQLSEERIAELARQAAQREFEAKSQEYVQQQKHEQTKRLVDDFLGKVWSVKEQYPDFEEKIGNFDFREIADLVPFVNAVDNTGHVVYDLINNPHKVATLFSLLKSPQLAMAEMKKISQSIKTNQSAANIKMPKDPLSQIDHSHVGTDSGSYTIRDLKKQPWLRG